MYLSYRIYLPFVIGLVFLLSACTQTQPVNQSTSKAIGLYAEYFSNPDFTGLTRTQVDSKIDFYWGTAAPAVHFPSGDFSAKWSGYLKIDEAGDYRFDLTSSGSTKLRINNELVSSNQALYLDQGNHGINLSFVKTNEVASLSLKWFSIVLDQQATDAKFIPQSQLLPNALVLDAQSDINLIKNSGFESGLGNWKASYRPANVSVTQPGFNNEGRALSLSNYAWVQQDIPASSVMAGTTYTLFANGKAESNCTVALWGGKANGTVLFNKKLSFTHNIWKERAATLTLPNEVTWAAVYINPTEGHCRIDNLSLSIEDDAPSPEPTDDLILNGEFSKGLEYWKITQGTAEIEEVKKGAVLASSNQAWIQQDINYKYLEPGERYRFSASAKAKSSCTVGIWGGSQGSFNFNIDLSFSNYIWEEKYRDITLPDNTIWAAAYVFATHDECLADDIKFELIEESPEELSLTTIIPTGTRESDEITLVDLSEDMLVILRRGDTNFANNTLFIYQNRAGQWIETQQIWPDDGQVFTEFSLSKNTLVVESNNIDYLVDSRFQRISLKSTLITFNKTSEGWQKVDSLLFPEPIRNLFYQDLDILVSENQLFLASQYRFIDAPGDYLIYALEREGDSWKQTDIIVNERSGSFFTAEKDTLVASVPAVQGFTIYEQRNNEWQQVKELGVGQMQAAISGNKLVFPDDRGIQTFTRSGVESEWLQKNSFAFPMSSFRSLVLENNQLFIHAEDDLGKNVLISYIWLDNIWAEQSRTNVSDSFKLDGLSQGRVSALSSSDSKIDEVYVYE